MRYMLIAAGLVGFVAAAMVTVVLAAESSMPDKYRFTGWMAPSALSPPRHLTVEGDGPVLRFSDSWNLTKTPVAYRVCVVKVGTSKDSCQSGTARVDSSNSTLQLTVKCCGRFLATWYVHGRVVARWPFRYNPERS